MIDLMACDHFAQDAAVVRGVAATQIGNIAAIEPDILRRNLEARNLAVLQFRHPGAAQQVGRQVSGVHGGGPTILAAACEQPK